MKSVWLILSISIRAASHQNYLLEIFGFNQVLEEALVLAELGQHGTCIQCHVQVIAVFGRKFINERVDHHCALFFEHLLHALLVSCQFLLSLIRVQVQVIVVRSVPLVLLFGLNLLLNQLDQQCGKRMMIQVSEKPVEDLSLLMKEQILQSRLLLLIKQLFHDFQEVSSQNWERVFVFIQELAQRIDQRVVSLWARLLLFWLRKLGAGELGGI